MEGKEAVDLEEGVGLGEAVVVANHPHPPLPRHQDVMAAQEGIAVVQNHRMIDDATFAG